jgi:hypothetical protein
MKPQKKQGAIFRVEYGSLLKFSDEPEKAA